MSDFKVGDKIQVINPSAWKDIGDDVGTIQALERTWLRVTFPNASYFPLRAAEITLVEASEAPIDLEIPEAQVLPEGDLWVISRHTVPTQVEFFGTDKDDRALYREVK
jgi:hypothetical protein